MTTARQDPADPTRRGEAVDFGPRIRQLRTAQGMSLRSLARASGLSVGFLSQVERGLSSMALSSLHAVARALNLPVSQLLAVEPEAPAEPPEIVFTLTRASDQTRQISSAGRRYELLSARYPGLILEPMLVHIPPGGTREPAAPHEGEEFAYVLRGQLTYEVGGVDHVLGPGDSLHLRSNTPHTMHNAGTETVVVVSVVTPRHY